MVLANTKTTNQSKDQHMEKTKLDFIKDLDCMENKVRFDKKKLDYMAL